jgi:hypothetical protein
MGTDTSGGHHVTTQQADDFDFEPPPSDRDDLEPPACDGADAHNSYNSSLAAATSPSHVAHRDDDTRHSAPHVVIVEQSMLQSTTAGNATSDWQAILQNNKGVADMLVKFGIELDNTDADYYRGWIVTLLAALVDSQKHSHGLATQLADHIKKALNIGQQLLTELALDPTEGSSLGADLELQVEVISGKGLVSIEGRQVADVQLYRFTYHGKSYFIIEDTIEVLGLGESDATCRKVRWKHRTVAMFPFGHLGM